MGKSVSGELFFVESDHLGSSGVVTNESGDIVDSYEYLPYGSVDDGSGDVGGGSGSGDGASVEYSGERLYTGKELDSTGLYYYGARYYSPTLRRFTQPDPIIADVYNPQNLNRYAYVLGNPYKYTDPDGKMVVLGVSNVRFSPSSLLLSQGKIRTNIPTEQVAPKNEIVPRPTDFSRGFLEFAEKLGFKRTSELSTKSNAGQMGKNMQGKKTLGRDISEDNFEIFRFDPGHNPGELRAPHLNHHVYRRSASGDWIETRGSLDHTFYYSIAAIQSITDVSNLLSFLAESNAENTNAASNEHIKDDASNKDNKEEKYPSI